MYHTRFSGGHYDAGFKWGRLLLNNGRKLNFCHTFDLTEERRLFAKECLVAYKACFPEILDEIRGIADGNDVQEETLHTLLFSMYCFEFENHCTCFAFCANDEIVFARNSDFLVRIEKLYMNCLYTLSGTNSFTGNTTAYVQMEDGVNHFGLAVGLTFVYPWHRKPGLNAGMLIRYLLEKCSTTEEAIAALQSLPIASAQTITIADKGGAIAVVECNPRAVEVLSPQPGESFVATANNFNSEKMKPYRNPAIDDWRSHERYENVRNALEQNRGGYSIEFAKDVLSGKYGFMCQYDRKLGADTVWSVVYDLGRSQIWRAEGNPAHQRFKEDTSLSFKFENTI